MRQSILLIGHKSFVGNDIKKTILKEDKFNIFYLEKYFEESDIISLNTKEFYEKYFLKFNKIDFIISCLHIHKENFADELMLNLKVYENIQYFVRLNNIDKIIYLSSVNVSENNKSHYAYVKYKVESKLEKHKNFIIIRPSTIIMLDENNNLFGGKDGKSFSIFEKLFKYNLPIPIIGNGKYLFTFCFLNDLTRFILLNLNDDFLINKKINFFSGEYLNFNIFIDYIAKIKRKKAIKIFLPLLFVNLLCKLRIFNYKNIDNLINQKINYDYCDLIKNKIKINQLGNLKKF